ncbi:unnamed protein product [Protopolystoma xenopodis]|uniref:Uncharacterized protein n=1 Tax=Protopolystoma xenopodis TaxID=117903 RepID=A0A3S5B568_9PLAT|nr:unnamed protein product [Protopolystoma xenopodis]
MGQLQPIELGLVLAPKGPSWWYLRGPLFKSLFWNRLKCPSESPRRLVPGGLRVIRLVDRLSPLQSVQSSSTPSTPSPQATGSRDLRLSGGHSFRRNPRFRDTDDQ